MNPLRLRATNFRTFETLDLSFEQGLIGILGELRDAPDGASSNGAGKSSLLEAIDVCLFGRRSLAGFLTRGGDVTELMLELTFEHAGETYRVRRSYSAKGRGKTTLDFESELVVGNEHGGSVWEPLTRSSTKETDALIVETTGLTRDTYRNSSYLRQGDGSYADPARDPKQRKDLLVEAALGRDPVWPRLQEAARVARRTAETGLERLAGETRAARELVDTKPDVVRSGLEALEAETAAATALTAAEAELQAVTERHTAAKDGAARRQVVQAELSAAQVALVSLKARDEEASMAARTRTEAAAELEQLPVYAPVDEVRARVAVLEAAVEAHREAVVANERAASENVRSEGAKVQLNVQAAAQIAAADNFRAKIAALREPVDAKCETCGQALHDEARAKSVTTYEGFIEHHEALALKLQREAETMTSINVPPLPDGEPPTVELDLARKTIDAIAAVAAKIAVLAERIKHAETAAASGPSPDELTGAHQAVIDKQAELDDIEPVNLAAIEGAGALCRANVTAARAALDAARTQRARLDERLAAITKAEQQLLEAHLQEHQLHAQIDVETTVEKACGRDGIPALILENVVIPSLEAEADSILRLLGTPYRCELRTQREKKDGGLADTLEVVILDDTGEAPYDDFSGGEQTRIGLALQIALAVYLALSGRGSRLLCLDEPSYLDAAGMAALLTVLEDLIGRGVFSGVLLVSHVAELRDSLDQTIVVVKDGGRSRIEGAEPDEPDIGIPVAA